MASITDLSFELIDRILHFSDFSTYLQLALTCKHLAHFTQRTMAHHRDCHALYKATSDISQKTLPALARALLHDPIAISHVRNLEFWGQRSTWSDWKPHVLLLPEPQTDAGMKEDASSKLEPAELDALQKLMQKEIRLSEQASQHWRQKIEVGDDGALKGMLVALCPNLEAVRFVQYEEPEEQPDEGEQPDEEKEQRYQHHRSCLEFLTAAIEAQYEDSEWSPGFLSLSRIALGVPSKAALSDADHLIYPHHALPLFRLPGLRSLYINGLTLTQNDQDEVGGEEPFTDRLPIACSPNLRELVFGNADLGDNGTVSQNLLNTMLDAAAKLHHVAFQGGDIASFDFDQILRGGPTVRSFLVYDDVKVHGYRSNMYYPCEADRPSSCTVDMSDMMLCAPWTEGKGGEGNGLDPKTDMVGRWGTSRSQFGKYIYDVFNEYWENIVFIGGVDEQEAEMIDEGLVEFIRRVAGLEDEEDEEEAASDDVSGGGSENGGSDCDGEDGEGVGEQSQDDDADNEQEEDQLDEAEEEMLDATEDDNDNDSINASETGDDNNDNHDDDVTSVESSYCGSIYLEGIDGTRRGGPRWYTKAIEAGRQAGIRVHTRTTPAPREHGCYLPWPASDKELHTSPWYGHPELERYLLKPHAGLVTNDCGNCGLASCKECLKVMDAAAWAKAHEEEKAYQIEDA